jgi:sugar-phosphatase
MKAAIFDMDGLLIDSEPLWYEAAVEVFNPLGIPLTPAMYADSVGLRTKEFVVHWFREYGIDATKSAATILSINEVVIEKINTKGEAMPGVYQVLQMLQKEGYTIGLATSSPSKLIDIVVNKLNITDFFKAFASAEQLPYGKPHPQVFLDCAAMLEANPVDCICFEDSFYGLIAAKAARMKCVVVPHIDMQHQPRWGAADILLPSLVAFNEEKLKRIFESYIMPLKPTL